MIKPYEKIRERKTREFEKELTRQYVEKYAPNWGNVLYYLAQSTNKIKSYHSRLPFYKTFKKQRIEIILLGIDCFHEKLVDCCKKIEGSILGRKHCDKSVYSGYFTYVELINEEIRRFNKMVGNNEKTD